MLRGKKVYLRPLEERDLASIMQWRNDPRILHSFFSPFLIHPAGQLKWYESLQNDPNRKIFIIETPEGKRAGMVGLDNIDWQNRQAENGFLLVDPDHPNEAWVFEAVYLLMEYAFKELNLHRIYSITYKERFDVDGVWFKWTGWRPEVVLRQAVFMDGKFHDKVLWGVTKEDWYKYNFGAPE
jgi:RimJ/RimL family protein N-acetyltransferase